MDDEVIGLHLGLPLCHPTLVTPLTVAPRSLSLSPMVGLSFQVRPLTTYGHSMKCPLATTEFPYHLEPATLYIGLMASSLMEPLLHRGRGGIPIFLDATCVDILSANVSAVVTYVAVETLWAKGLNLHVSENSRNKVSVERQGRGTSSEHPVMCPSSLPPPSPTPTPSSLPCPRQRGASAGAAI